MCWVNGPASSATKNEKAMHIVAINRCFRETFMTNP